MKPFLLVSAALALFTIFAQAQKPEHGLYRGYVTVTRSNAAFNLRDVITILVSAEIYSNGTDDSILWTARNLDQSSRLANLWADHLLLYDTLPETVSDTWLYGEQPIKIPGGDTVPGSFKMTAKSLAWKSTSVESSTNARRNVSIATTFSITRIGPAPAPDQ